MDDLRVEYQQLRTELDAAYRAPIWNKDRIDHLADEVVSIEFALASQHVKQQEFDEVRWSDGPPAVSAEPAVPAVGPLPFWFILSAGISGVLAQVVLIQALCDSWKVLTGGVATGPRA